MTAPGMLASTSFTALGTTVTLVTTEPALHAGALRLLRHEVAAVDAACSRFRDDSELTLVNAGAGRPVRASELLLDAVDAALRAARLTDGRVDPTVGVAMRVLGYDRDFSKVDRIGPPLPVTVRPVAGWRLVWTDRGESTVRVPVGVELDLGATAKALCADRAARAVAARAPAGSGVLVSLGGDIAVAGQSPPGGWPVRVTHLHTDPPAAAGRTALRPDPPLGAGQTILLTGGGLATSGVSARRWLRGGRPLHHLVDPETGWPAPERWQTVSVAAGSCVDANIASTAAIILGDDAPGWLSDRGLPARLVSPSGEVVLVAGWPADSGVPGCS